MYLGTRKLNTALINLVGFNINSLIQFFLNCLKKIRFNVHKELESSF